MPLIEDICPLTPCNTFAHPAVQRWKKKELMREIGNVGKVEKRNGEREREREEIYTHSRVKREEKK
jgi:hypothetical protein